MCAGPILASRAWPIITSVIDCTSSLLKILQEFLTIGFNTATESKPWTPYARNSLEFKQ